VHLAVWGLGLEPVTHHAGKVVALLPLSSGVSAKPVPQDPMMNLETIRSLANTLPEVTEEPHFDYTSFRVRGKIFATVPPDATHVHVFVAEEDREQALALHHAFIEKLYWGKRVLGLRVDLSRADPQVVAGLLREAWRNKAPRRLAAAH
jgi:hypothetical protein